MINCKTKEEIGVMAEGGRILKEVLDKVFEKLKAGVTGIELDKLAEKLILEKNAFPAFKNVKGYGYSLCISANDEVVHGIPREYEFKEGDVVGIDCGVFYKGFNTDAAWTKRVGEKKEQIEQFLGTGERALDEAIKVARIGNRIGHISKKIQDTVERKGYSVVRSLVGHGVGKKLHEDPEVPGFLDTEINNTPLLKEGMVLAIEVIYNMGKSDVVYGDDNWTIKSKDGSLSGLFEKTVAVTKNGSLILTV